MQPSKGCPVATVTIDDLVSPVLTPLQLQLIANAEEAPVDLDPDELLAEASKATGLGDFGSDDFRPRLDMYVSAINADDGCNNLNRMTLRRRIIRLLSQRLLFNDLLQRHPEIHGIEIERPLVVVGLPRSGTTHLVNLLASDPRRRALPYWESQEPFPLPGEGPGVDGVDPRYARCATSHQQAGALLPFMAAMHDRFPSAIEEEVEIQDLDFSSYVLEWHARVPAWRDHYLTLDQTQHYAYLRTVLQALTFLRGPRQWVLKSPQHCEQLGPLLATFPDATFAFTHRDPVAVIQSAVTMLAYGDRMRRHAIDPDDLADYWIDRIEMLLRSCVRDRHLIPPEQSLDIAFHELNGHEMDILDQLYRLNGTDLTEPVRTAFNAYLNSNPRGSKGRMRYRLHEDFGRSPDEVRARFDFYFDRFNVKKES
ncbi:sulfotransferase [Gordonia McavH-238-E]|nr:sulfotransferase [Gordonia sp. McavH-238-E]MCG7631803.1 sulfotransferase [Gordonia sp. McavH-238-E]